MIGFLARRRYMVRLRGTHILVPCEDSDEPYVGFDAVRFVRARGAGEAGAIALARVRNDWFNGPFGSVNPRHEPVIQVRTVEVVRNPFRRSRPNGGYTFLRSGNLPPRVGTRGPSERGGDDP